MKKEHLKEKNVWWGNKILWDFPAPLHHFYCVVCVVCWHRILERGSSHQSKIQNSPQSNLSINLFPQVWDSSDFKLQTQYLHFEYRIFCRFWLVCRHVTPLTSSHTTNAIWWLYRNRMTSGNLSSLNGKTKRCANKIIWMSHVRLSYNKNSWTVKTSCQQIWLKFPRTSNPTNIYQAQWMENVKF